MAGLNCTMEGGQATKVLCATAQLHPAAAGRNYSVDRFACIVVPGWSHSWKPKLMSMTTHWLDLGAVHEVTDNTAWQ